MEELVQFGLFIVAASALREALRGDVFATVKAEFQAVLALDLADVVGHLIEVLDGELGCIGVGSDVDGAHDRSSGDWGTDRGRDS